MRFVECPDSGQRGNDVKWRGPSRVCGKGGGAVGRAGRCCSERRGRQEVQSPQAEAELEAVRRSVIRGVPFGEPCWQERTAKRPVRESTLAVARERWPAGYNTDSRPLYSSMPIPCSPGIARSSTSRFAQGAKLCSHLQDVVGRCYYQTLWPSKPVACSLKWLAHEFLVDTVRMTTAITCSMSEIMQSDVKSVKSGNRTVKLPKDSGSKARANRPSNENSTPIPQRAVPIHRPPGRLLRVRTPAHRIGK